MARSTGATKFASVNLNQSYGKPPQQAASPAGTAGSSARSRLTGTTHGGMLLLSRPTRPQPVGQKILKLSVPRPVNLPSLRREHAGNDPSVSLVGGSGTSGWIKQQQISDETSLDGLPIVDASAGGRATGLSWGLSQQSATADAELRPQPQQTSGGRNGVYTPPAARFHQANATPHQSVVVPSPRAVEKAVLLRGEEFPTLKASLPAATVPPQQRQKELQQKQRDKQKELKEQQKKLHQLTQKHQDEEAVKIQQLPTQPQNPVSLQPQSKIDPTKRLQSVETPLEQVSEQRGERAFREEVRSLHSGPAPFVRLNHTSNWADDERDVSTDLKSRAITIDAQEAAYLDWIDREPESFGYRRPFHRDPSSGRNMEERKGFIDIKDSRHAWELDLVKENARHGNATDSGFKKESTLFKGSAFGTESGYGRDSFSGRERTSGREHASVKNPSLGDGGAFIRNGELDKSHNPLSDGGIVRAGSFSRGIGLPARDSVFHREMGSNKEVYSVVRNSGLGDGGVFTRDSERDNSHMPFSEGGIAGAGSYSRGIGLQAKDSVIRREMGSNKEVFLKVNEPYNKAGTYDNESQYRVDAYLNGKTKSYTTENHAGRMSDKGRSWRDSHSRESFQNRDPAYERESFQGRDGYNDGFSLGRYREAQGSFRREGFLSTAGQNGELGGAKASGRFRGGGVRDTFQDFGMTKAARVEFSLDNWKGRTGRNNLFTSDPYTRAFTEFVAVDYRAPPALGLDSFEIKGLRRKKDVKESNFRDFERESFEAELERVQKLLEEERQRKIEEQERAIELAKKEQEEHERLAKEEEERKRRLEEEAREAAAKAEQEALEAVRKAEEIRRAREQEKQQMILEEERRKENARCKLLELEERIAKREAESKRKENEEHKQMHGGDQYHEESTTKLDNSVGSLVEGVGGKSFSVDQDDDDRAPLRPPSSERPSPRLIPLHNGPLRMKNEQSQQFEGFDATLQQRDSSIGSLESDTGRPSPWRRGPSGNSFGSALTTNKLTGLPDDNRSGLPRDRTYYSRKLDDWDSSYGSSYNYLSSNFRDRVNADKHFSRDRVEGPHERRYSINDDVEPAMKISNGHLGFVESDRGSADNFHAKKDADYRKFRDRIVRQPSWEGRPHSPLSPRAYQYGMEPTEDLIPGRLRQSLPKQPRVPPPPLQAYQKLVSKSTIEQPPDYATHVHGRAGVSDKQEDSSKQPLSADMRQTRDLSHKPPSTQFQQESQSGSSEAELDTNQPEEFQDHSAHGSDPSSPLESVSHASTHSAKLEPVAKSVVESQVMRAEEEEDSGEDGDEELLEDSEAAEYEDELSSEEKRETDEEDYDDLEDEKIIGSREAYSDEVQESPEGESSSGEAENSKSDEAGISLSEEFDLLMVDQGGGDTVVAVDIVNTGHLLESVLTSEQHHPVSLNDFSSCDVIVQEKVLKGTEGIDKQLQLSSEVTLEVQTKQLQEVLTSSSLAFQSAGLVQSHAHSTSLSLIQEQHSDCSTMMQSTGFTSAAPLHVPSLCTALPGVQNHVEVPMTLQFGLLPSTPLLPASVPAIQIGSIQMPLPVHMHSHLSPHVTHYQPAHASPFQFGQLGHPLALSQLLPTFGSQPQPTIGASVPNEYVEQQSGAVLQHDSLNFDVEKMTLGPARYVQDVSVKTANTSEDELSTKKTWEFAASKMEKQSSLVTRNRDSQVISCSADDSNRITSQHIASADGNLGSGTQSSDALKENSEHMKNEGGPRQQGPGSIRSEAGNLAHRNESGAPETKKEKDWQSHSEILGKSPSEEKFEGITYRARSSRRISSRRSEFRPRESFVADESLTGPTQLNKERYSNSQGTEYIRNRINDKVSEKDGSRSQGMQEKRFNKDSRDNSGSAGTENYWNIGGRNEVGGIESAQRNLTHSSGRSISQGGDGLVGRFGAVEDVPVQSGVVHVFEQPGIEILGDEDDFIEVRSKRQMLNDRREQREKEIEAKSKAKEQVVRKQRPSAKHTSEGDGVGPKLSNSILLEKKTVQVSKADQVGSSSAQYAQSGAPTVSVPISSSLATLGSQASSVPGTTSSPSDAVLDKKMKLLNSGKTTSATVLQSSDGEISSSPVSEILNQDNVTMSTHAWGGNRSNQQVVSLTQIQLEEVLKPVRYDLPLQPQLSLGEHGIIGLEAGGSNSSVSVKERSSASVASHILPPLNGEKIQFGAVTSTYVSPISRPNTPSILGAVGSSVAFRSDAFTEANEMRKKVKQLPVAEDDVTTFGTKGKRNREDGSRNSSALDSEAEAEAEAAASAVAVAAISNDDSVNNTKYGSSQSSSVSGILNSASLNSSNLGGHISSGSSNGLMLGASNSRPPMTPAVVLEDSMTVALPADLSVETHSFSLGGPPHSGQGSSGLLLPSVPLPSLPTGFPALDLGPVIGGHMFTFGSGSDLPTGFQGAASGAVHEQGAANLGLSLAGWQQHVGVSDSYYGAPHGFAGPFMSPSGAVPNLQAPPHHMLVYTNPFGSIGQFGQLGFIGPTYIQSGKQPDWTHTPVATSSPGLASMSTGELGLGGALPSQRSSSGVASPIQRLAPGPSVVPVTHPSGPFDFSREATFQIPPVEVSMQPQWSHVSVPHLQNIPTSGPLLGYFMQSRQTHGPLIQAGHLQHVVDGTNMHMVPPTPVNTNAFQSVDASAQFPDELGLGDSIYTTSISAGSYVGQQLPGKGALGSAVSSGDSAVSDVGKMQRGRRPRMTRGGSSQGAGEGSGGNGGVGTNHVTPIGQSATEGRSSPSNLQPHTQVSLISPVQHPHHVGYADQKVTSPILRPGVTGGWPSQGSRKVGVAARPQLQDRGVPSDKNYLSSAKLKQVYVVKPSTSYKGIGANSSESVANMFIHEMSQTGVDS